MQQLVHTEDHALLDNCQRCMQTPLDTSWERHQVVRVRVNVNVWTVPAKFTTPVAPLRAS